jgi:hypothetical protein
MVRRADPKETVFTVFVGNITRWYSDYEAIKRALRLREPIEDFVRTAIRMNHDGERDGSARALENDQLLPKDWEYVRCVMDILEPFKTWTNRLQKKYCNGYVADILPAMDELLTDLERAKVFYQSAGQSNHLLTSINNAWDVLNRFVVSLPVLTASF